MADNAASNEQMMGALANLPIIGILFLMIEKKNEFIRFQAMQSTVVWGVLLLFYMVMGIVPILGWVIALILSPLILAVWFILLLVLMWKAYTGEKYKLPYFGELAEKLLARLKS